MELRSVYMITCTSVMDAFLYDCIEYSNQMDVVMLQHMTSRNKSIRLDSVHINVKGAYNFNLLNLNTALYQTYAYLNQNY